MIELVTVAVTVSLASVVVVVVVPDGMIVVTVRTELVQGSVTVSIIVFVMTDGQVGGLTVT